jgi:hypothetical protein
MSIRRNKDGSLNNSNSGGIVSIGIIGGSFRPKRDPELEEKYRNWVEECAKSIKACPHSIEETEQFFLKQCEAVPMSKDDHRMKSYQYSVVMNYLKDKLDYTISDFPFDGKDEEIEKWDREQGNIRGEIMKHPPEYYGIKMSGYYLPQTERNSYLYEEVKEDMEKVIKQKKDIDVRKFFQDICFFFEETTADIQCNNGGRSLINKLFVFRGVREEDIKARNARFHGYLSSLRRLGYLPDFREQ